jgi:hypothetical protein
MACYSERRALSGQWVNENRGAAQHSATSSTQMGLQLAAEKLVEVLHAVFHR